ncbi:MAG: hypothetical protein GY794_13860 [bacterium]|nr:hypothetical protein [bacterium]
MSDFQIQTPFNTAPLPMGPDVNKLNQYLKVGDSTEGTSKQEQAAKDFESVLINQLMQEMARTVPDSGLTSSSVSKQIQGMFWSFLSEEVADNGGMGLWKDIQKYCLPSETADASAPTVEQKL